MPGKSAQAKQAPGKGGKEKGKGRPRKYSDSEDGKEQISYEVYESAANTYFSNRDYRKAIDSYTKALELRQGEINCLIARSKCNQELGNLEKALKDADDTLKAEPNHVKGILQKAEVLYSQGDFETSLVNFHRGKKIRPEIREFTLGIQKSTSAIENAVGPHSGVELQNSGDLSYFYEAQQQKQGKKKGYNKPGSRKEDRKRDQRPQSIKQDSKTIKQLLGELYADREYLDNLLTDIDDNGAKTETNEDIRVLAIEGLRYLNSRSEFWQQQKPMYSRKRDKEMRDGTKSRASSAGGSKKDRTKWVLNKLEEIDEAQVKGDYQKSLKMSKKLLNDVQKWSERDVQNRAEMIANLHSCLGNAYLEMGEYKKALDAHNKDLEIAKQNDIEDAKSRALDNLGRVYARMGKFDKAVSVWEDKLPLAKSALEKTWLYHEIGRCYLEMGEYETALDYGERSLAAAEEADDDIWQLNATVLIAQSQVKCGEYQEALDSFEKALDMAKLQNDKQAESAIKKALDDVNKKIVKGIKDDDDASSHGSGKSSPREQGKDNAKETKKDDKKDTKKDDKKDTKKDDKKDTKQDDKKDTKKDDKKDTKKDDKQDTKKDDKKDDKKDEKKDDKKGKWTVRVYTTDMKGSGTNANVYLTMYGKAKDNNNAKSEKINLDNKGDNFESGNVDEFEIESLEFDKVEKIRIGQDNSGMFAGWHLDKVELENKSSKKVYTFQCDRWLADDEDDKAVERELTEGVKQKSQNPVPWTVKVHTTDKSGSGTNANVYITLFGKFDGKDDVQSDKINLDNKGNNFEDGKCDEFDIETKDYDKVTKIRIGHDNSGLFAGWHLNKVELKSKSGRNYTFMCDRWLADDEDDKKMERDLVAEEDDKKKKGGKK